MVVGGWFGGQVQRVDARTSRRIRTVPTATSRASRLPPTTTQKAGDLIERLIRVPEGEF